MIGGANWPSVLAATLIITYLTVVLGRKGAGLTRAEVFRTRNQDGPLGIAVMAILLLLLVGAQLTQLRTSRELSALARESEADLEQLRRSNQDWSLKHRALAAAHEPLPDVPEDHHHADGAALGITDGRHAVGDLDRLAGRKGHIKSRPGDGSIFGKFIWGGDPAGRHCSPVHLHLKVGWIPVWIKYPVANWNYTAHGFS